MFGTAPAKTLGPGGQQHICLSDNKRRSYDVRLLSCIAVDTPETDIFYEHWRGPGRSMFCGAGCPGATRGQPGNWVNRLIVTLTAETQRKKMRETNRWVSDERVVI